MHRDVEFAIYSTDAKGSHRPSAALQEFRVFLKINMPPNSKETIYILIYFPKYHVLSKSRGYNDFNGCVVARLVHNTIYKSELGI